MIFKIGESITYDSSKRELTSPSKRKRKLARGIHKFLMCLLKNPDRMASKEDLLVVYSGDENEVRVYARRLRIILKIVDPSLSIDNKYGRGYTLNGTVSST
jgi:DNA-binding response OmpR family regulator